MSEVLLATSFTICAPMFSNLSLSSISFATETPSLVTVGAPNERSSTTLRPFGPRVTLTESARMLTPFTMRARAVSRKRTSLAAMFVLLESRGFEHAHDVLFADHEQFFTFDFDGLSRVLAEEDLVAALDVERADLAIVENLALADFDDFAGVGLLGGGIGDHDAGRGLALFLQALHQDPVVQRTDLHIRRSFVCLSKLTGMPGPPAGRRRQGGSLGGPKKFQGPALQAWNPASLGSRKA